MNGQDDKPRSSPSGSSSAQSPPQDAARLSDDLDDASVKRLGATLDSLRQQTETLREENRVLRKQGEMREGIYSKTIQENDLRIAEHDKRIDRLIRLARELIGEGHKEREIIVQKIDESAKHLLLPKERVMSQVKTVWFVFWVAQLIATAVAASGALPMGPALKLLLALGGVFTTISTFLAAQWRDPDKKDTPALPADSSSR